MLEIAVCEDTAAEGRVIAEYAEAFFEERGMEPGVYEIGRASCRERVCLSV